MSELKKKKEEELELTEYVFDINDEPVTYTLEAYKNKERPVEKQMRIVSEPLSAKESDVVTKEALSITGQRNKMDEEEWNSKYTTTWVRLNFFKKIKKMENIFFKINGKVKEVTDPKELYNIKDKKAHGIITEMKGFMAQQDEVVGDDEKN